MNEPSNKPYSPSCERNREPILDVLRNRFADRRSVLEIGSGSGQHAVFFAAAMPHLQWQTSDRADYLTGIQSWLDEAALANTPPPMMFDVGQEDWPKTPFDAIFTANTLHIMAWPEVERLFARLPEIMSRNGVVVAYGPFNINGEYTSASNTEFDRSLQTRGAQMAIRDLEAVDALAASAGLERAALHPMPANNFCVIWQRPVVC